MKHTFTLLTTLLLAPLAASHAGESRQLFRDAAFSEGFGAAFIYGKEFSGGRRPPIGTVTAYRDIAPWQVHLIPCGPVAKVGVRSHPWDFQEGYHENYTNPQGEKVRELHMHRLVVNHVVEVNTPEKLQFAQFNNDGLAKDDPARDTKLVKRVTTDRRGTIRLHYNSQNEIRNAATAHTAQWARDTWPHFLLNQRFETPVALADYRRLDFTVTFQVDEMKRLSSWPGPNRSSMNLNFMFQLRHRTDPAQKLFAGMMLFTSSDSKYQTHLGVEQHGMVFYRESVTRDQPKPEFGQRRTVSRELHDMITTALRQAHEKQPALSANPDDFELANFSIGLEGMGHWETECEINKLSLTGFLIE
ncbi:MAG: hypothetical protein ACYC6Y_05450 [Thermoguttaceae bacterium]